MKKNGWKTTEEEKVTQLLGINFNYNADGSVTLVQTAQIKRIKEHFFPEIDYKDIKQTYIPMPREWSLEASEKSPPSNVNEYLSHIGVTMYMLKTRLEIATSISLLSGQGKSPSELDVHAIFHLASYLLTTATVGLTFYPGSDGMDRLMFN